jgi:hypothetical protein
MFVTKDPFPAKVNACMVPLTVTVDPVSVMMELTMVDVDANLASFPADPAQAGAESRERATASNNRFVNVSTRPPGPRRRRGRLKARRAKGCIVSRQRYRRRTRKR